jgi:hypothetical protein
MDLTRAFKLNNNIFVLISYFPLWITRVPSTAFIFGNNIINKNSRRLKRHLLIMNAV